MNFILGAGISAIILKLYDKDNKYKILGEKLGGQLNSEFKLGPRILKRTEESETFVKNYLKNKKIDQFFIGYFYEGFFHDYCEDYFRKLYFEKTRGYKKSFENSSMNDNNNIINGFNIEKDDVSLLCELVENHFINENVLKIDVINKTIETNKNIFQYDKIINTIPANIFNKLCNFDSDIQYEKTYFYKVRKQEVIYNDRFDFVYYPENHIECHRATKIDNEYLCIEVMEKNNTNKFNTQSNLFILNTGHLKSDSNLVFCNDDIINFGRYAVASHNIRMHDVISFAYQHFKEKKWIK